MIDIRESETLDLVAIESLYPLVFPDEDLLPIVRTLLSGMHNTLSLIAMDGNGLAGHILFTNCSLSNSSERCALLGPLAVTPERQHQGIGSKLIRKGFEYMKDLGMSHIFVLGDPAYYARFGFVAEDRVCPPYQLPDEWKGAWQSLSFDGSEDLTYADLCVPTPWQERSLWAP